LRNGLLLPNYAEVSRSGKWLELNAELEGTARNRSKNLPVSDLPKINVLLHGDVAIAHGLFTFTVADGKSLLRRVCMERWRMACAVFAANTYGS
jgi:hypothetical protein